MLTAPPPDGVREEGAVAGTPSRDPPLPSTEREEPPPFQVESRVEEPELCSPTVVRETWEEEEEEEGSERRPGESGGADFRDIGGRSEP